MVLRTHPPRLDGTDCRILAELQQNARVPFAELGRRIALSTPSVIERVRRLEEAGVIVGYHAQVDPTRVGRPVRAFIKVSIAGDRLHAFGATVRKAPGVRACYRVTGEESFIIEVAVRDTLQLEQAIDALMPYVATNTSMILTSLLEWNPIVPEARESGKPPSPAGRSRARGHR